MRKLRLREGGEGVSDGDRVESVLTRFTGRHTPFVGAGTPREPSRGNAKTPRRQDAKNGKAGRLMGMRKAE